VELFRQLLDRYAIEQLPGKSLAETVARAAGISARELKDLLWERAQAIGLCSSGMALSY
jgi:tryptophanase